MMEIFSLSQLNWFNLLLSALALLAIFFLLKALEWLLTRTKFRRNWQLPFTKAIQGFLNVYEALAIVLLSVFFILINPVVHGTILAVLFVVSFPYLRNYFNGRFILMDRSLEVGKKLRINDIQGLIVKLGRLGLKIRTSNGLHHISYSHLLNTGYTLVSGEEIGEYCSLLIVPPENRQKEDHVRVLTGLLSMTPYLDWNFKPEFIYSKKEPQSIETKVILRDEDHLHELVSLINEWGYSCSVAY